MMILKTECRSDKSSCQQKTYIKEKYLICFLSGAVGLVIAAVLGSVIFKMPLIHGEEPMLFVFPVYFAIAEIMTAVMIPTRIKFGPENPALWEWDLL